MTFTRAPYLSILSQINSVHIGPCHFLRIRVNIILPSVSRSSKWSLSSGFPTKFVYTPLLSPVRATRTTHFILACLITRSIFDEVYRSWSSSFCILLHIPLTSFLPCLNMCVLKCLLNATLNCVFAFLKLVRINGKIMKDLSYHKRHFFENMKGWHFFYEMVLIPCTDTLTLSPTISVWTVCRIVMKVAIDIIYKTVLSKFEFHENRRSGVHTLLKDVSEFRPKISVFIDWCR